MMTVGEHDLDEPPAVVAPLHGKRVPMVEITGHLNGICLGRTTVKIGWPERSSRRKQFAMQFFINRIHGLRPYRCFPGWCFIFHESSFV
jgi:hypothetical protein